MRLLEINDLSLTLDETDILKNVSFSCKKGEILTIVGPNGCGKSTTLKMISRILAPSSGSVKLWDKDIRNYPSKELARIMAVLPQRKSVPADLTVEQLVQYGRYPHTGISGRLKQEDYEQVDIALEATGITQFRHRTIATLSGGESQMAWIAMCVAQQPQIILLDEPTTYLDISYQLEVLELVKKLNREQGLTIVMVLHDINQAIHYSDKIFMMHKGSGYQYGVPRQVFTEKAFAEVFSVKMKQLYEKDCPEKLYFQPDATIPHSNPN